MTLIEVGETAATTTTGVAAPEDIGVGGRPLRADVWRRFRRDKFAIGGAVVILLLTLIAIFAPIIAPYDPTALVGEGREGPSMDHYLGTDQIGRDLFSRVVYGARVSLRIGYTATAMTVSFGLIVGATAGFFGRWIDTLLMRLTDILLSIPYIVLAVAIATVAGRSENSVIIIIAVTSWGGVARIVRSSFLSLKRMEYVEAARSLGYSRTRILTRHMLPNALQPIIVYGTITIGAVILTEAALSFLAVGPQDPTPAWGLMVAAGKGQMITAAHLLFVPAAAIALTVMAFVFVGDGLRDALDPKMK